MKPPRSKCMKVDQVIDILLNSSDESESLEDSDDESKIIETKKENHSQSSIKASKNTQKEEIKSIDKISIKKEDMKIDNKRNADVLTNSDDSDCSDDSDDLPLSKLILKKSSNTSKTLNDSSSQIKSKPSTATIKSTKQKRYKCK